MTVDMALALTIHEAVKLSVRIGVTVWLVQWRTEKITKIGHLKAIAVQVPRKHCTNVHWSRRLWLRCVKRYALAFEGGPEHLRWLSKCSRATSDRSKGQFVGNATSKNLILRLGLI